MMEVGDIKILCVDDEPLVLEGLRRTLGESFDVFTATSGAEGLDTISKDGPFAVVVSDMRMPQMDGAVFLSKVREASPHTVRVLLTGHAEADAAARAVNEGGVFRFLCKPCPSDRLLSTVELAAEHHRLAVAERDVLEKTLAGSVTLLAEVLALASPEIFSRATALRGYVQHLARALDPARAWQYETAALLSQVGCVAMTPGTAERMAAGLPISEGDRKAFDEHPQVAHRLLARIPRLAIVAEIVLNQREPPRASAGDDPVFIGATMIALATDVDRLVLRGSSIREAVDKVRNDRRGRYPANMLDALFEYAPCEAQATWVRVSGLVVGMTFDQDVVAKNGTRIVAKGTTLTGALMERVHRFAEGGVGITEPLRVRLARR
jgi:response regulator RpfG family c-di-GMP phosphodiesterase